MAERRGHTSKRWGFAACHLALALALAACTPAEVDHDNKQVSIANDQVSGLANQAPVSLPTQSYSSARLENLLAIYREQEPDNPLLVFSQLLGDLAPERTYTNWDTPVFTNQDLQALTERERELLLELLEPLADGSLSAEDPRAAVWLEALWGALRFWDQVLVTALLGLGGNPNWIIQANDLLQASQDPWDPGLLLNRYETLVQAGRSLGMEIPAQYIQFLDLLVQAGALGRGSLLREFLQVLDTGNNDRVSALLRSQPRIAQDFPDRVNRHLVQSRNF